MVRLWPPSIQWVPLRNWNCPSAGSAVTALIVPVRRSRSTPLTVLVPFMVAPSMRSGRLKPTSGVSTIGRADRESTTGRANLSTMTTSTTDQRNDGQRRRRADGERTRSAILRTAASLATVEGLEGLSIGNLAAATGISQSGLYAHFGSKQELQLATVEVAERSLTEEVVRPALAARPGLAQLAAACEAFFSYVERRVFPGGCFFASTSLEMGARPGPVKERLAAIQSDFTALLRSFAATAIDQHELPEHEDPDRLAFELHAILLGADTKFVLNDDPAVLDLARQVVRQRLGLNSARTSSQ